MQLVKKINLMIVKVESITHLFYMAFYIKDEMVDNVKYYNSLDWFLGKITMNMLRTFHPIGQGAFYTEEFDNYTIVYDCGSDTNITFVNEEIKSFFEKGKDIDAVFISHLHNDHVNGLEFLLSHCNVKKVFLPLLANITCYY